MWPGRAGARDRDAAGSSWRPGGGRGGVELAPEERDARPSWRTRPSRSRPWLAVTVPETAGDVGSAGMPTRVPRDRGGRVTDEGRNRHRSLVSSQRAWELHASAHVVQPSRTRRGSLGPSRGGHHITPPPPRTGPASPTTPSRPGRLIAVTASQDRDETPRTDIGLPERPEQRGPNPRLPPFPLRRSS